jgi:serine/threonine-protein kinase
VIGTPEFMSPEQLVGDPADARSDIYSLGCILYLMLVGSPAADAPTRDAMLKRRLNELPPHPSSAKHDLPPELDAIVVKMLAISPADRYQSAAELREALDNVRLPGAEGAALSTSGSHVMPGRTSLDPSKAPTLELPLETPTPLPSWAPTWMGRPTVRRAARTAAAVAGVALVAGAAAGALTVAMRRDHRAPPHPGAIRDSVVAQSGARAGGGATTTVRAPAGPTTAAKTPSASVTHATPTTTRAASTTTPRGSTTVVSRPRSDTASVRVTPPERRAPVVAATGTPPPIKSFAAAIQSGDIERVKRVYPGITPAQRKRWEALFSEGKPEQAIVKNPRGISNDPAIGVTTVEFAMAIRYQDRTGNSIVTPYVRYQAKVKVQGPVGVLLSLTP